MGNMSEGRRSTSSRRWRSGVAAALCALPVGLLFAGSAPAAECEDPEQLRFSIIPTEETIQELTVYKPVLDMLSENTGKEIEFYMPTSYASVVEALLGKWVDVAVLGPYSYIIAHDRDPSVEVFATYAKKKGHFQEEGPGYKAVLITKKGSEFTSIDSLQGSVLALTDPASTSGNLIPRVLFPKETGMPLEDYFSKVVYSGEHDLSTMAVEEGRVDAAFVATHRFDNVVDRGMVKPEDFNVLWSSPVVPQDPFVYRGTLCQDLKDTIAQTFLTLHEQDAAAGFLENVNAGKFVKMTAADYEIIRELEEAKAAQSQ